MAPDSGQIRLRKQSQANVQDLQQRASAVQSPAFSVHLAASHSQPSLRPRCALGAVSKKLWRSTTPSWRLPGRATLVSRASKQALNLGTSFLPGKAKLHRSTSCGKPCEKLAIQPPTAPGSRAASTKLLAGTKPHLDLYSCLNFAF